MTSLLRRPLAALALLLPVTALGGNPAPTYQYKGEIAGVVCAACSKKVKTSLEKLPGVSTVKITPSETSGLAKLQIVSTSPQITKESATLALGKDADSYQIQSLEKEPPAAK